MSRFSPGVPLFRIQVAIPTDHLRLRFYREVMLGVRQFGFETKRVIVEEPGTDEIGSGSLHAQIQQSGVHGLITAAHTEEEERRFSAWPVPVVNVSSATRAPVLPYVSQDDESVGRIAASHLLSCGCRAFGFWGRANRKYAEERMIGFKAGLADGGFAGTVQIAWSEAEGWPQKELREWLTALPRPAGVFAVHDMHAAAILRTATSMGWRVPEDFAILGAGDDDFWVEYESVKLSSVRLPSRIIGYEAAASLHRILANAKDAGTPVHVPVRDIAVRRSTNILHVDDPAVAKAIVYIREHACENPYVSDVARAAAVSLTALQMRFRHALGRSLSDEIERVRIARAQELLADTDFPMSMVAERCGFSNSQLFSVRFRQITGVTPSAYRRQFRPSARE